MSLSMELGLILWFMTFLEMVHCGLNPIETGMSVLGRDDFEAFRFPDDVGNTGCTSNRGSTNLAGRLNFLEFSNTSNILIGAAEALYILDEATLGCQDSYEWLVDPVDVAYCIKSMVDVSGCFNFLSLYEKFPFENETRLLLCSTQSGVDPLCRTLEIRNRSFGNATAPVRGRNAITSVFPQFNSFGEFRKYGTNPSSDTTFFSAGVDPGQSSSIYNITYHEVLYDSQSEVLMLRPRFSIRDLSIWLNDPVQFIEFIKADHGPNLQFYYIFLRERELSSTPDVVSRIARICQDDKGRHGTFTTFLKAPIFCRRNRPADLKFQSGIIFNYNEINSVALNDGGRYSEDGIWKEYMYASFSGNILGPRGTAICLYLASKTLQDEGNNGLYSVFRKDITDIRGDTAKENKYFECSNNGRPDEFLNFVLTTSALRQIGMDPILILDGINAVKILLDKTCVVQSTDRTRCLNHDTFFLGTDGGSILKVIWFTISSFNSDPIISEELSLDDDSTVTNMVFRLINGTKMIFASTSTKVYSFPLERCHRFQGCRSCIRSRDPYCVWNNMSSLCETGKQNNITTPGRSTGVVPRHVWQNIHTGIVNDCEVLPVCTVIGIAVDHETIRCIAGCNETTTTGITSKFPYVSSEICVPELGLFHRRTDAVECMDFKILNGLGLHNYECTALSIFNVEVTTKPGPPTAFEDDIYVSCGQTSCEVCIQELNLTDYIYSYTIQIQYTIGNSDLIYSPVANFQVDNGCVFLSNLTPGETLSYIVELRNSVAKRSTNTRQIKLLDSSAGPVLNIIELLVTNQSAKISWTEPAVTNGTLSGYSIYVNGSSERVCASGDKTTEHNFVNLLAYTNYTIEIRACNGAGESRHSSTIALFTDCGIPSAVTNATVVSDSKTLTFLWDTPQFYYGDVRQEHYNISYICYTVKKTNDQFIQQEKFFIVTDDISPRTLCCADINAINSCPSGTLVGFPTRICGRIMDIIPGIVQNLEIEQNFVGINSFVVSWNHPQNYRSPDLVFVVSVTDQSDVRIYQNFIFLAGLQECTEYVVGITAENPMLDLGKQSNISVITLPGLPPPPENVVFMYSFTDGLSLTWDMPDIVCITQNISNFKVSWSCGFQPNVFTDVAASNFSIVVNLTSDANFGLCYAVVQSCNNFTLCGPYTNQVTIEITEQPPPQPQCFLHTDEDTGITVSFLFPSPFVPSDLELVWSLSNKDTNDVVNGMYVYNLTLGNVVNISTETDTDYMFQLYACNVYDCGSFCTLNFSTSDVPLAPHNIVIQNRNSTSALMTWEHFTTRVSNFLFTISITSSCQAGDKIINHVIGNEYMFRNLCSNSEYTVSIRTTDIKTNKISLYSNIVVFSTDPGIPSAPRYVQRSVNLETMEFVITWHTPSMLNAVIIGYEVKWSFMEPCNTDSILVSNQTDANEFLYKDRITYPIDIKTFFTCVRARTSNSVGLWGMNSPLPPGGLFSTQGPSDCNSLIIVACVAIISVFSSIFMVIILSLSVYQYK